MAIPPGPWIQDDDYEVSVTTYPGNQFSQRNKILERAGLEMYPMREGSFMFHNDPGWYPIEDGTLMDSMAVASQAEVIPYLDSKYVGTLNGTKVSRFHPNGTFGQENWENGGGVAIALFPWLVLQEEQYGYYPSEWAEGAVSFEWEDGNELSEWVSVRLDAGTQVGAVNQDSSGHSGAKPLSSLNFNTKVYVASRAEAHGTPEDGDPDSGAYDGSYLLTMIDPEQDPTYLGEDIDLTQYFDAFDSGVVVYTTTDTFIAPVEGDDPTLFDMSDHWDYGYWITMLAVTWTARPPRYRFIYELEPEPPVIYGQPDGVRRRFT